MIWIELIILLACIVIGARLGGIALGTLAGVGLLVTTVRILEVAKKPQHLRYRLACHLLSPSLFSLKNRDGP